MNVKVENIDKNVVQLEIEVDAAKFEEGMEKSYRKNAKKFNVPGFRKGKAPRKIVERYYGEQVLYEDAINFVCPEAYDLAVKEKGLQPVERPEIDIKQIGGGNSLIFTARVTVKPDVELGEYKGVEVKKAEASVTDEDVENELKRIAERNARLVTVEDRPAQNGDTVFIDFEGFIDGKPFEGGSGKGYPLVLGSGTFIPGFEDQLVGVSAGEEKEVNVTFPEDYKADLAGKQAMFKVKVNEIKLRELPALDDEFAKDVSEFDTLEAFKADLREKLRKEAEHRAEHENENNVIDRVVENATVDIPRVMIDNRIDSMVRDFDLRLRYQGLDLQKYLEIMGLEYDDFRKQFEQSAEKDVKTQLVIEKIGEVENVEVSEADVEAEIARIAENYKQSAEDFKKHLTDDDIQYIKADLKFRNTIKLLVDNAKFV